jgi:hypothetical protein
MTDSYTLTFAGFLSVRLMQFEYAGKKYSYHGRKLENAVRRLTAEGGPKTRKSAPAVEQTAELVIWGQATHDWKHRTEVKP